MLEFIVNKYEPYFSSAGSKSPLDDSSVDEDSNQSKDNSQDKVKVHQKSYPESPKEYLDQNPVLALLHNHLNS